MLNSVKSFQGARLDRWIRVFGTCLMITMLWMGSAIALDESLDSNSSTSPGAKIFEAQCAGCHAGGGNIIRRGKNLKLKALQKNKFDTLEAIVSLVTLGKGNMSAYADRITPEEINTVSAYVLSQAQQNWK